MHGTSKTTLLFCPMKHRSRCPNLIKIVDKLKEIVVFRSGLHCLTSHRDDQSRYLKLAQKQVVRDAVRMSPLVPGATVRRNLNNLGPDKRVDPKLKKSVQRLVRKEKETILSEELDGVKTDGSYGSLAAVAQAKWFVTKVKAHNQSVETASKDAHHLKPGW